MEINSYEQGDNEWVYQVNFVDIIKLRGILKDSPIKYCCYKTRLEALLAVKEYIDSEIEKENKNEERRNYSKAKRVH